MDSDTFRKKIDIYKNKMANLFPSTAGFITQPNSGLFDQFLHNKNEAHLPCPDPISYEAMIKIFTFYFYFLQSQNEKDP